MSAITTIIPIDKFDNNISDLLQVAVKSHVETSKRTGAELLFVGPKDVLEQVKAVISEPATYVENEKAWFSAQINAAVKAVKTDYFSILEYDDEFSPIWYDNVAKYIESDNTISVYLPLTEVYDYQNKMAGPIGYLNEAVWASSFSEKIGYFDSASLGDYLMFNTTGGVFRKDDFVEVGGLKESIKLSFWYEFLLRALNKDKSVFVIPKIGYFHLVNRPDSLASTYATSMSERESDFWIDVAKKEFLYKKDRNKTYEE